MGKIDLDKDVQSLDFGSKSDTRIQTNLERYQIKTIRELCHHKGLDDLKTAEKEENFIEMCNAIC